MDYTSLFHDRRMPFIAEGGYFLKINPTKINFWVLNMQPHERSWLPNNLHLFKYTYVLIADYSWHIGKCKTFEIVRFLSKNVC